MAAGIQFSDTDGNPSHRPDGSLGYILAPHEAETDYRSKIGKLVAPKLTGYKPGLPYILKSLPDGYSFWEKHRKETPSAKAHVDRYLYGHPTRRIFRSANEFGPHALWLLKGREEACICVCCTNKRTKNSTIKKPSDVRPKPALRAPATSTQGRTLREKSSITTKKEAIFTRLLSDLRKEIDIDVRIRDPDDVAFNIEQKNFSRKVPKIASQGSFIPRAGELVLFHTSTLNDPQSGEPVSVDDIEWKAGIVTQLPHSSTPSLTIDELTLPNPDKTGMALNYSGFRIETMSDPNSIRKDEQLRWHYLPLACIRSFSLRSALLSQTSSSNWDQSILNAMKSASSFSLALPSNFVGHWPNAWILHGGIHLGSELIVVGDAIIVGPSEADDELEIRVMIVTSIALAYKGLQPDPPAYNRVSGDLCNEIEVRLHGRIFDIKSRSSSSNDHDGDKMNIDSHHNLDNDGGSEENSTTAAVDEEGFPPAMRNHPSLRFHPYNPSNSTTIHSISLNRTIGRLHEAEALTHYRIPDASTALDIAVSGVNDARSYARQHDRRILDRREAWRDRKEDSGARDRTFGHSEGGDVMEVSAPREDHGHQPFFDWFWAKDRVEALGVDRWGEFDVGEGWEKFVARERLAYEG